MHHWSDTHRDGYFLSISSLCDINFHRQSITLYLSNNKENSVHIQTHRHRSYTDIIYTYDMYTANGAYYFDLTYSQLYDSLKKQ